MAKENSKVTKRAPNKHLSARISFLHKAAEYIASQQPEARQNPAHDIQPSQSVTEGESNSESVLPVNKRSQDETSLASKNNSPSKPHVSPGMPSYLCSQLRQVALKSQIRLAPAIKQTCCKRCDAFMVEGQNCDRFIENLSRGGKKPHANVTVLECNVCGAKKRQPIGAVRQRRKGERQRQRPQNEFSSANENEILPT